MIGDVKKSSPFKLNEFLDKFHKFTIYNAYSTTYLYLYLAWTWMNSEMGGGVGCQGFLKIIHFGRKVIPLAISQPGFILERK